VSGLNRESVVPRTAESPRTKTRWIRADFCRFEPIKTHRSGADASNQHEVKEMKFRQLGISVFLLAAAALSGPTHAGDKGPGWDYKSHPGNSCFAQFGHESGYLDRAPNYLVNVALNQKEGIRVVCPIVRDNAQPSEIDASITTTRGVSCSFFSIDRAGNTVGEFQEYATENMNSSGSILKRYFSVPKNKVTVDGYFVIRCTVGPVEAIYNYMSGEYADSTDYGT
jgi:hypothetical protein